MKKFLCIILTALTVLLVPTTALADTVTDSPFRPSSFTHQAQFDEMKLSHGVDLSNHNGTVDFKKLKNDGVEFVFLRLGARGYGYKGSFINDTKFATYYDDAKAAGIKIGAYFYSQALNEKEATEEADKSLNILNGRILDLPIAYDYEFASVADGRLDSAWANKTINKDIMTKNAIAFCERIKSKGYQPMVYASKSFFYDNLNYLELEAKGYQTWLAHYTTKTDYKGKFNVWQYSDKGTVDGISGNVDCNFMYLPKTAASSPEPPSNITLKKPTLTLKSTTTTTATIEWNSINNASGYEILRKRNGIYIPLIDVENVTSTTVAGLKSDTKYYLYIRAYVVSNGYKFYGDYSNCATVQTKPSVVTGLKLKKCSEASLTYTWNSINEATKYRVEFYNTTNKDKKYYKEATTNSIELNKLTQANKYSVRVQAYINGWQDYSSAVISKTLPEKATGLKVDSFTSTSVALSWDKLKNADGYIVYKYDGEKYVKYKAVEGISTTTAKVTGLKGGTSYKFRVAGYVNNQNIGAKSTTVTAKTKLAKVTGLTLKPTATTIKASWDIPNSVASGYQIVFARDSEFKNVIATKTVSGKKNTTYTGKNLTKGKRYYIRVRLYYTENQKTTYGYWSTAQKTTCK